MCFRASAKYLPLYTIVFFALVIFSSIFIVPFTKVEESFNTQAVHDVLSAVTQLLYQRRNYHHVSPDSLTVCTNNINDNSINNNYGFFSRYKMSEKECTISPTFRYIEPLLRFPIIGNAGVAGRRYTSQWCHMTNASASSLRKGSDTSAVKKKKKTHSSHTHPIGKAHSSNRTALANLVSSPKFLQFEGGSPLCIQNETKEQTAFTITDFDHLQFSGVVPRTFMGAIGLSLMVLVPLVATDLVICKGLYPFLKDNAPYPLLLTSTIEDYICIITKEPTTEPDLSALSITHNDILMSQAGDVYRSSGLYLLYMMRMALGILLIHSIWTLGKTLPYPPTPHPSTGQHARVSDEEKEKEIRTDNDDIRINTTALDKSCADSIRAFYHLCCAVSYHIVFYSSRTIPNVFALISVTYCVALLRRHPYPSDDAKYSSLSAFAGLAAISAIFRSDIIMFIATLAISYVFVLRRVPLMNGVLAGLCGAALAVVITVPIDTYLWQVQPDMMDMSVNISAQSEGAAYNSTSAHGSNTTKFRVGNDFTPYLFSLPSLFVTGTSSNNSYHLSIPSKRLWLWPEAVVLYFNTIENKSAEWGTSPLHWYFTNAMPKAFMLLYPLVLYGVIAVRGCRAEAVPAIAFVAIYSLLPHKEVRFILPVFPVLLCPVAVIIDKAWQCLSQQSYNSLPHMKRMLCILGKLTIIGMFVTQLLFLQVYLQVSRSNYPGAAALEVVHKRIAEEVSRRNDHGIINNSQEPRVLPYSVYIDAYAAMTGITRFHKIRSLGGLSYTDPLMRIHRHTYRRNTVPDLLVGYTKHPMYFNFDYTSPCEMDNNTRAASSCRKGVNNNNNNNNNNATTRPFEDEEKQFDFVILRSEWAESFDNSSIRWYYDKISTVDSAFSIDFKRLRSIRGSPFLVVYQRHHRHIVGDK